MQKPTCKIGDQVTIVYEITDPVEFEKHNLLGIEHHGMKAVRVAAFDVMSKLSELIDAIKNLPCE